MCQLFMVMNVFIIDQSFMAQKFIMKAKFLVVEVKMIMKSQSNVHITIMGYQTANYSNIRI